MSPRHELSGTDLSPNQANNKHTPFGSPTNQSSAAFFTTPAGGTGSRPPGPVPQQDYSSIASSHNHNHQNHNHYHYQHHQHQASSSRAGSFDQHRPDSPAINDSPIIATAAATPSTPTRPPAAVHMRQASHGGSSVVSSGGVVSQPNSPGVGGVGGGAFAYPSAPVPGSPLVSSPSPALGRDAPDYVSVHNRSLTPQQQLLQRQQTGGSGSRRSMFHENPDDLGENKI